MKKITSVFLALLLIIGLVPMSLAEDKPVITIAVQDKTNVEDFNTNLMTLQLEEACNVDLQMVVLPATDYNTKLNMMFATGGIELPDVILARPNSGELLNWIDSGLLLPLNEYFEDPNQAPNIYFNIKDIGFDFTKQIVMPDGNIYFIPNFTQSQPNESPHKALFNTKWLEKLNVSAPTTPEELYDLFIKVKNSDLNGNGKNDEIGLVGNMSSYVGWFSYIMNAFIYAGDSQYLIVEDGVVDVAYNKPEWQEGLKFIRRLFAEDLIPKEILTQDDNQYLAMLNSGEACTTMMLVYTSPSRINASSTWRTDFEAYPPLINEEFGGPLATYRPATAPNGTCFFITRNCKNPDLAFKLGDTMVSRHFTITTRWGQEGQDWDYIKNVPNADDYVAAVSGFEKVLLIYNDAKFWSSGEIQNRSWMNASPAIRGYGVANGRCINPDTVSDYDLHVAEGDNLYSYGGYFPKEVIPKLTYNADEITIITELESTLKSFRDEWTANFLAGNLDLDKDWDAYVKELEAIGIEEYLEIVQRVYDRMYK